MIVTFFIATVAFTVLFSTLVGVTVVRIVAKRDYRDKWRFPGAGGIAFYLDWWYDFWYDRYAKNGMGDKGT